MAEGPPSPPRPALRQLPVPGEGLGGARECSTRLLFAAHQASSAWSGRYVLVDFGLGLGQLFEGSEAKVEGGAHDRGRPVQRPPTG
jgi:hypothetical protein